MISTLQKPARAFARGTGCTALSSLASVAFVALVIGATACGNASRDDLAAIRGPAPLTSVLANAAPVVITPRSGTVRIPHGEHPLARPEFDQGRLDAEQRIEHLSLFFSLSPEQRKDRDALAAAQLDPKSPSFHRWLTPETYRERFGAKPADIARARAWLAQQGFTLHATSRLGTRVTFGAAVKDLETAFQTEMHRYRVGQENHYAMATAPAIPESLKDVVLGLHNAHDFFKKPVSRRTNAGAFARRAPATPDYTITFPGAGPDGGSFSFPVLGPPDWAAAYDVASLYDPGISGVPLDGAGVTIGIVGTAAIAQSDINAFRTTFGLPATTVTMTLVPDTGASAAGQQGAGLEAILDLEWSGGIAKGAHINYVYVGGTDFNVDDASFYLIEENIAPVMSESYGGCELGDLSTDADILEENGTAANLEGITYMASAGDDGAADCVDFGVSGLYVDLPGSFPGVTAVGGTQFPSPGWNAAGNLLAYPGIEVPWNEQDNPNLEEMGQTVGLGAGGGGISSVFARPAYQAGVAACTPVGTLPFTSTAPMRQVPDVALSAASETPGYYIECTFDTKTQDCASTGGTPFATPIGGTSASSPSFAGVVAILNEAVGERLGNINPILYQLEASALTAAPFHDITSGSNEIACGDAGAGDGGSPAGGWPDAGCSPSGFYGFAATVGYDCATGVGSIDAYNLVSAWVGRARTDTTLVPTPDSTSEGVPVTLAATVNVDTTDASALTGDVTFAFESFTASGKVDLSWELGTVAIADGTTTSGHATLTTTVPPGASNPGNQYVDVTAFYGGDTTHLPSQSAKVRLSFAPISFVIVPATLTLAPNATHAFTTLGGTDPVRWFVTVDTTETFADGMPAGSSIGEADGGFVAGPKAGYTEIEALDSFGAEAFAEVTIGDPKGPPPWADAGVDSGVDAGHDAGVVDSGQDSGKAPVVDAAEEAAPAPTTTVRYGDGSGGCSCDVAGGQSSERVGWSGALSIGFGLAFFARRRRARSSV